MVKTHEIPTIILWGNNRQTWGLKQNRHWPSLRRGTTETRAGKHTRNIGHDTMGGQQKHVVGKTHRTTYQNTICVPRGNETLDFYQDGTLRPAQEELPRTNIGTAGKHSLLFLRQEWVDRVINAFVNQHDHHTKNTLYPATIDSPIDTPMTQYNKTQKKISKKKRGSRGSKWNHDFPSRRE